MKTETKREKGKLTEFMDKMDLIFIEHSTLKQKNIRSSQHLIVPSPKLTVKLVTKWASTDTEILKLFKLKASLNLKKMENTHTCGL